MEQKTAIVDVRKRNRIMEIAKELGPDRYNMVYILMASGMHIQVYTDPVKHNVKFDGDILSWRRPKNRKVVTQRISNTWQFDKKGYMKQIKLWLSGYYPRLTRQQYHNWLKKIGRIAKYPNLSANVLRHTYCYRRLIETNCNRSLVMLEMQCSMGVLDRNYSLLSPEDIKNNSF